MRFFRLCTTLQQASKSLSMHIQDLLSHQARHHTQLPAWSMLVQAKGPLVALITLLSQLGACERVHFMNVLPRAVRVKKLVCMLISSMYISVGFQLCRHPALVNATVTKHMKRQSTSECSKCNAPLLMSLYKSLQALGMALHPQST